MNTPTPTRSKLVVTKGRVFLLVVKPVKDSEGAESDEIVGAVAVARPDWQRLINAAVKLPVDAEAVIYGDGAGRTTEELPLGT